MIGRYKLVILAVLLLLGGTSVGFFLKDFQGRRTQSQIDARQQQYDLLARRIFLDNPNDNAIDFRDLQTKLEMYIARNSLGDKISLNFEYLPTGSTIGIGENQMQAGASLLKLPLAISLFKEVEQGRVSISEKRILKKEWLNDQYGDLYKKGAGYELTIDEALKESLGKSDNTATLLIFNEVSKLQGTDTPDILSFIDANYAETQSKEMLIDSRSYSSILKCLYFACHVNVDNSQRILSYLTQSSSHDRLTKFIPKDIKVAHKIGTFHAQAQSDCGIFYVTKRNYILCVMIADDDSNASRAIADISKIVYSHMTSGEINRGEK